MPTDLTETDIQQALDQCAEEPVHIPGRVQACGCLFGVDHETGAIQYASANCEDIMGQAAASFLGTTLRESLGKEVAHALQNAAFQPSFQTGSVPLGFFRINERPVYAFAFAAPDQDFHVIEFEAVSEDGFNADQSFDALSLLIESIQGCRTQDELFDLTVELTRQISGYDRVMVYRFDLSGDGEIVAEEKRAGMDTFIGLRFPSYDIPVQARAIMAKLPLRFIQDVDNMPVPLLAANRALPPLDISYAFTRGVSPIHMEYLRNMGVKSTMTLSIVIEGRLWGMISFHHQRPKVPSPSVRRILTKFVSIFSSKLEAIRHQAVLDQVKHVDALKDRLLLEMDEETDRETFFDRVAPQVSDVILTHGIAIKFGKETRTFGDVPSETLMNALLESAREQAADVLKIENLAKAFPDISKTMNQLGGALVYVINAERAIFFFRRLIEKDIHWAGNPEKTVDAASGQLRLVPRGSFMTYLEKVSGSCESWTEDDVFFARRLGALVNSAERRSLLQSMNRQQSIMIDELNHRVRNILALVRSISNQSRRHHRTLDSYAGSLEARIQALAIVHDIALGASVSAISLKKLITVEFAPYESDQANRVVVKGADPSIRAEFAPVLSLVIHELATNAAKYGALSVSEGIVTVSITTKSDGYALDWRESGGPPVTKPDAIGFGSTLIEQAIPHELKGASILTFDRDGVTANIFLPDEVFEIDPVATLETDVVVESEGDEVTGQSTLCFPAEVLDGTALVLEDSFVVAKELGDQLSELGFADVVRFSDVPSVLDFLQSEIPRLAVLDVSLGNGETSNDAALKLHDLQIPFVFVSGYGERADVPEALASVPRLRKPLKPDQLHAALAALFEDQQNQMAQ